MRMYRSVIAALVSCVAIAGFSLAATPTASAAANPSLVHFDTAYNGAWTCTGSSASVRMNPGDSLRLTWSSPQGISATWEFRGPSDIDVPMSTSAGGSVSFSSLGTYRLYEPWSFNCALTVFVVSEPVEAPQAHDYLQQVGVPASGNCADVPTWVGHLPGFPIGGWGRSWAQWIYDGRGGPVCTRVVETRPDGSVIVLN